VLLFVEIGADGIVGNINVVRGLGLGLDQKAVKAVSQWRFLPGTENGQAVKVAAQIEVNFRLL
jgi:periplasmic protein TonB